MANEYYLAVLRWVWNVQRAFVEFPRCTGHSVHGASTLMAIRGLARRI